MGLMRLFGILTALTAVTGITLGQGTIAFNTRVVGYVDAPVWAPGGTGTTGAGSIPGLKAQLYLFSGSGPSAMYVPLFPITTFYTGTTAANRYVVVPPQPVVVPSVGAGEQATIIMRVYNGESFDVSTIRGQTVPITITLGGTLPDGTTLPPALLIGLNGNLDQSPASAFLRFYSITRSDEQLEFTAVGANSTGAPVGTYVLETSTDFDGWTAVATNSLTIPTFSIRFDLSMSRAFFRLRMQ